MTKNLMIVLVYTIYWKRRKKQYNSPRGAVAMTCSLMKCWRWH